MKGTIVAALTLALPLLAASQVVQEWVSTYSGSASSDAEEGRAVAVDSTGNVFVAGVARNAAGNDDFLVIKYSPAGTQLWAHQYQPPDGNGLDHANALVVDVDGNVIVTGVASYTGFGKDYLTVKYDTDGNVLWMKRYSGITMNHADDAFAIALHPDGGILVTGGSGTGANGRCTTIKYAPDGTELWVHRFDRGVSMREEGRSIAVAADGSTYVAGYAITNSTGPIGDYLLLKYTADGTLLWSRTYNGTGNGDDRAAAVGLDDLGNAYVIGSSRGSNSMDIVALKYAPDGSLLWTYRANGASSNADEAAGIAIGPSGNVYIVGSLANTNMDIFTAKLDASDGSEIWRKVYNGTGSPVDHGRAIAVDSQENVYITGQSGVASSRRAITTIKYDSSGNQIWLMTYLLTSTTTMTEGLALCLDSANSVYVTGRVQPTSTTTDVATIKYSQPTEPELTLDIQISGAAAPGSFVRGIEIILGGSGAGAPITINRNVTFSASGAATVVLTEADGVPPYGSGFSIVAVRDPLHTLRTAVAAVETGGDKYTAEVLLRGGDANGDNVVDIVDYALLAMQYGYSFPTPDTPLGTPPPHTDFSCNGSVGTADYSFIVTNFLLAGDPIPGGFLHWPPNPRRAITVRELLMEGVREAPWMDLNRDGWVTVNEITRWLFGRGVSG